MPASADHVAAVREQAVAWLADNATHGTAVRGAHEPMHYRSDAQREAWLERVRAGGWLCLSWPEQYGGRGLDELQVIAINEEFARAGVTRPRLGMGETLVAPALLAHGTPAQQARFLPRILDGSDRYCQGFSEPEAGSDLAHLRTRGTVEGDELVLDGTKIWQSGAPSANMIFALCRTDPDADAHRGLSYVLVPMVDNGVRVEPIRMMTGDIGFAQVHLDRARASLDNVIGGLHRGWRVAMTTLGAERAGEITTQHLGYRHELRDLVRELRLDASDAGAVPDAVVDAYVQVELMRVAGVRVADALRLGAPVDALLAVDKLNWSEYHVAFGELAMQLLGIRGLRLPDEPGYPVTSFQRILLESRGRRIARGTNQIQRTIIAERVLGLPK